MGNTTILLKRLLLPALAFGLAPHAGRLFGADQTGQGWPKEFDDSGYHLVLYQPQVDSWKKDRLEVRAAATATRQGQSNEIFGIVTFSARTEVDKEVRMVALQDLEIKSVSFPGSGSSQGDLTQIIKNHIQSMGEVSLDRLLADVSVANAEFESESASTGLKNDPRKIIFSTTPAVLILIDGEPVLRNIAGARYRRVINTPALLVFDPASSTYYLDGQTRWLAATNLNGPWSQPAAAPLDLEQVRAQAAAREEKDPHDHSKDPGAPPAGAPPTVYVSTQPAELIQTQGAPKFAAIRKTHLTYVTNTGSDIFVDVKKQDFYILLSGRWYTAKTMNGPWSWVAGAKLPGDFSHIPPDNPKSAVLASAQWKLGKLSSPIRCPRRPS
jgi:hypothetical protein